MTNQYIGFQVNPADLHDTRVVTHSREPLGANQVRFRVDEFALTANNITYATAGTFLGYLDFFPVTDGSAYRYIPVMGHGEVIESAHPDIGVGGRYFGFFPMAGEHVLAAATRGSGIWDDGAHRSSHAPAYRQFENVSSDPNYRLEREASVALLRGMFITSYLVDDYFSDNNDFGAQSILVTSASSKTSLALGFCLRQRGVPSIGITSARNHDAVVGLRCYDRVINYDDVTSLDFTVPTAVVDMAGNSDVISALHHHFGHNMTASCMVGGTHRDNTPRPSDLPGAAPQFFFAPSQIEKRNDDWGPGEVAKRVGTAFQAFLDYADTWLNVQRSVGADAAKLAYDEVVDGASEPTTGHVLSLAPPVEPTAQEHRP